MYPSERWFEPVLHHSKFSYLAVQDDPFLKDAGVLVKLHLGAYVGVGAVFILPSLTKRLLDSQRRCHVFHSNMQRKVHHRQPFSRRRLW